MRISDWSSDVCSSDLENTIVIFMSDHGEMLGDHGIYLKGPYFYEPAVRVPLIVSWPGTIAGGRSVPEMVELVDLAPTLLDAAGLAPFAGKIGRASWRERGCQNGSVQVAAEQLQKNKYINN